MVARGRLLIVDDEPAVLGLLKRYLERLGYAIETAPTAEAALEIFQTGPDRFDLVITDLRLPGMSGEELLERMRDARPALRALLSSGLPHQPAQADVGFLLKPYLPSVMVAQIELLLS